MVLQEKAGLIGSERSIEGTRYIVGGDIILSVDGIEVRQIDDILNTPAESKISRRRDGIRDPQRRTNNNCHNYSSRKTKCKLVRYKNKYFNSRNISVERACVKL